MKNVNSKTLIQTLSSSNFINVNTGLTIARLHIHDARLLKVIESGFTNCVNIKNV